ncbi:MAG TPA: zf-HC2 domain-containing protein [Candidatus Angelobacter sp.]|nr:zf-HC2 domain-containing protein [Candidatus Angelobacter sp.]
MDHNEAIRLQAAEKYVLGELPGALQEEFEEHFFGCGECAHDIKAATLFVDNAREVLREQPKKATEAVAVPARGGWFGWLKPIVAVPAFAVLLLVIGYQNTITIPQAEKRTGQGTALVLSAPPVSLRGANVRGEGELKVPVHANDNFGLDFDFTPRRSFDQYLCQLQDETGRSVFQVTIPGTSMNREVQLTVPGGLVHAGKYNLVFTGSSGAKGQPTPDEVLRLTFTIEIQP